MKHILILVSIFLSCFAVGTTALLWMDPLKIQAEIEYPYATPIEDVPECDAAGKVGNTVVLVRCLDEDHYTVCYINVMPSTAMVPSCREE